MRTTLIFAALIACAMAASCASRDPMSISEFRGWCIAAPSFQGGDCAERDAVCGKYVQVLSQKYPDAETCRAACNEVRSDRFRSFSDTVCGVYYDRGFTYCAQACNQQAAAREGGTAEGD